LLGDLASGKYKPGQKLPSEATLGQRFRTSRITVGRALRELKTRGLVEGVAGSGNYVRRTGASGGSIYGLLIPNLGETDIFEPICRGMASAPDAQALLWGASAGDARDMEKQVLEDQAIQLCRQFVDRGVAGVFFAPLEFTPHCDEVNARICASIDEARIPMVLLDRGLEMYPVRSRYDLVGIDNRRAGYLATEHLLERGCRDVAILSLSNAAPTVRARVAGYRDALLTRGVELNPERVRVAADLSSASLLGAFQAAGSRAIVCANDRIAAELMRTLTANGYRIPQDVRLVGMDDLPYARLLPVPLTTITQPCREIGIAAMAAMTERRKRPEMPPREVLIECRLTVRESSGSRDT
jgi:DNA-binding LacI/PurR family transcriptional regulator